VDRGYMRPDFGGALRWCLFARPRWHRSLASKADAARRAPRRSEPAVTCIGSAARLRVQALRRLVLVSLRQSRGHVTGSAKREAATPITARPRKHPQGRVRYGLISHQSKEGHGIGSLNK
jgi:hypothetical protein